MLGKSIKIPSFIYSRKIKNGHYDEMVSEKRLLY